LWQNEGNTSSPELSLLNFFAIDLPSQHFLAAARIQNSHIFHNNLLEGHTILAVSD